jgi:hypothetical protein
VHGLGLVNERRVARDHEEPAQLGQCRDDVFADPVGKILLFRIAAHIGEGKHRNRGPVRQRQGRPRRFLGFSGRRIAGMHVDVADEAKAPARDGSDHLLVSAAVADGLSGGVDAASQRGFRHDPAAPDRSDQIVLADDAVPILRQVSQQIEHLRLDMDGTPGAPQFTPFEIDLTVAEGEDHP